MIHVGKQWVARMCSLCVVGPIVGSIVSGLKASDGSHARTFLGGGSFVSGLIAMLIGIVLVGAMGVVIGRLTNRREGILNMAFALGWGAWMSGRMGDVYRLSPETGTLIQVALESGVLSIGVLIALILMTNPEKGTTHGDPDEVSQFDLKYLSGLFARKECLAGMLGATGVGLVIAFIFGQSDLPGQSVGAGFFAGIGGGLVGTLVMTSMGDESKKHGGRKSEPVGPTPFAPLMIGVMLCGVIGSLVGIGYPGTGSLLDLSMSGGLPGFLNVSPLGWVMGALLGVPVGHSWVEHTAQQAQGASVSAS